MWKMFYSTFSQHPNISFGLRGFGLAYASGALKGNTVWGGDLDPGRQQKQEEGHACCINTPLSVNVNLSLTARKQESKELQ